jgi:hypothetical protein
VTGTVTGADAHVRLGRRQCGSTRALQLERAPLGAADIVGIQRRRPNGSRRATDGSFAAMRREYSRLVSDYGSADGSMITYTSPPIACRRPWAPEGQITQCHV